MRNVLITGGAGFIGLNLTIKLISKGYNITILDCLSPQIHGKAESSLFKKVKDKCIFIKGDIRVKTDLQKAIKGQEIIIHLAAETGTGQSMYEKSKYFDVNVKGTENMLELLAEKKYPIEKIIIASSRAIYGEGKYLCQNKGFVYPSNRTEEDMKKGDFNPKFNTCSSQIKLVATDEKSKIHPTSIYGVTKQKQEELILSVAKSLNIPAVSFRYQNVYGPGQSLSNPYTGILSVFSTRILNNNNIDIYEDGLQSRDFVYIQDVVDATILGIEEDSANGEVFNVGSGVPITVNDVANCLKEIYNSNVSIILNGKFRLGDIRHNYADLTKIKNLLGFKPKYSFEQGIHKFVEWVKKQEINEDKYENSIIELISKGIMK